MQLLFDFMPLNLHHFCLPFEFAAGPHLQSDNDNGKNSSGPKKLHKTKLAFLRRSHCLTSDFQLYLIFIVNGYLYGDTVHADADKAKIMYFVFFAPEQIHQSIKKAELFE